MSTDVSGMIECRPGARLWGPDDEDTVWEVGIDLFLLNRGNAYDGLACLLGIRNSYGYRPRAEDRGFPDDAPDGLRGEFAGYGGPHDVHGDHLADLGR
ncbi:hypothetical protein QFZ63_005920 [Streptomyces sp. B3I7]|uniref:hypothetical protein n=1 Tax=Streptomyces sp. B3I7 TaxID=3042269 RepID=UPI0027829D65|nr:hypothetical protein [Streptomyces sp. B3I7]MDQ0814206.1 hypothetical protein [Streptomyces sp. B3I7]